MAKMRFSKWDLLPIALVAALAVAVFLLFLPGKTPASYVQIYQDGKLVQTLSLAEDATFTVTGTYTNVITVSGGRVAVTHTDCPGGDCAGCGWRDAGSIVCLPNRVEIRLVSQSDVDIVVG